MGKKWDGKTLKQSYITYINKYIKFYSGSTYRPKFTQASISNLWICSKCGKFHHQHTYPAFRYKYSWLCVETYSAVAKLIDETKHTYGVTDFLFCDNSSSTRTFTRMFVKNEELSLLVEAYIKLTRKVEST
jgi:hypothetical protein